MYFRNLYLILSVVLVACSCSQYRKLDQIRAGSVGMSMSVPNEQPLEEEDRSVIMVDSIRSSLADEPFIMNAVKDSETGEMVATDVIRASTVTARFRNVAERAGYVSISFDVSVPGSMADSRWQLKLCPYMRMMEDTVALEPVYITGEDYRAEQLRGYERYRRFMASIITDTTDFIRVRQLEIFLRRHFPDTYAMKTDSSYVSDPLACTLFGTTQEEALRHYTMKLKKSLNERRKARAGSMYDRYVKDPIVREGIRLDTVMTMTSGDFLYRYVHTFKSRPFLRKVIVSLEGGLYESGERILDIPFDDSLTFYISSLASLADEAPRYRMIVLERRAYDNTWAFLEFAQGSSVVDTLLGDNAQELKRIKRCIDDVAAKSEYALDSLLIVASCSPEGAYQLNRRLSSARAEAVREYLVEHVPESWKDSLRSSEIPENWERMKMLVSNDTVLRQPSRKRILKLMDGVEDPDVRERRLSEMSEYRYLREKIYPQLRCVKFDFHLHRIGMVKDTVHTTEPDTVYLAGVRALKNLDYKKAVTLLRPYGDYNAALACMAADYNHSALDILNRLPPDSSRVCYLKAVVLSRLGVSEEAMKYYELAILFDPSLAHRANLDPELSDILKLNNLKSNNYE